MALKDELYDQNKKITFAENIDRAWGIYSDENRIQDDRRVALDFLIYAFNIRNTKNLNKKLIELMAEREIHKAQNPEYIPGLSPKQLGLKPNEMSLGVTLSTKESSDPTLGKLFKMGEMLDVNNDDKVRDRKSYNLTRYFSTQERARYRVHLFQGKFYQCGSLFDTTNYIAHGKVSYAAYTLNANGELSIFNHHGMADRIAHSSLNAGAPVVGAGELMIKNGELLAINTYSGHYGPNLFSVYRTLEYFVSKGIDVSKTKIYTFTDPKQSGLNISAPKVSVQVSTFYEIPASHFFNTMRGSLELSIQDIKADIRTYQSFSIKALIFKIKDFIMNSSLTQERKSIAIEVERTTQAFLPLLKNDHVHNSQKAKDLKHQLEKLREKNKQLSLAHGKEENSGRLHHKIDGFIQQAESIIALKPPSSEVEINNLKLTY